MVDLARWLGECLDEDERKARALVLDGRRIEEPVPRSRLPRVLREIDVKRQMLDRYEELRAASKEQGLIGDVTEEYENFLLRLLASVYADRPGYREEWRP